MHRTFSVQAFRDGPTNKVRARMSVASAVIFGSVFWRMGKSQTSIQDRMGLLQVEYCEPLRASEVEFLVCTYFAFRIYVTYSLSSFGTSYDCSDCIFMKLF